MKRDMYIHVSFHLKRDVFIYEKRRIYMKRHLYMSMANVEEPVKSLIHVSFHLKRDVFIYAKTPIHEYGEC